MNAGVADKCPEWDAYFVEAFTLYVVDQAEPRGYVTSDNAQWLIDCIARDGRVEPANELELLGQDPRPLAILARTTGRLCLEDRCPCRAGRRGAARIGPRPAQGRDRRGRSRAHPPHSIRLRRGERRIDLAHRGGAPVRSQRPHLEADNHPAWRELFVKAIGNYLDGRRNRPGAFADRGDCPRGMASGRRTPMFPARWSAHSPEWASCSPGHSSRMPS